MEILIVIVKMKYFYTFLKRFFFLLVIYTSSRLFFYVFNSDYFNRDILLSFLEGIRFDISALLYINIPLIVLLMFPTNLRTRKYYRKATNLIFYITNIPFLLINNLDIEYFKFSQKRSTYDFFEYLSLGGGSDAFQLIPQYIFDYWNVTLIVIIQIYFLLRIKKIPFEKIKNYFSSSLILIITIGFFVLGARGGIQLKPIKTIDAGIWSNTENSVLVLNSSFCILHTYNKKDLETLHYFSEEELNNNYNTKLSFTSKSFSRKNVVIIIMESFSKEYIGYYNNAKGYTPFLDSLMSYSFVMERAYSNGIKSIEALPAITAGIPTLMNNPFITSSYATNHYKGLADLLKEEGYTSSFFHGGNIGTMGFYQFSKKAGFDKYFGREDYNNEEDYDGSWGIYDGPFFRYFYDYLNKEKEPFISSIFSLSSHPPYNIPEEYKNSFDKGELKIHESIGYSDYALGKFFINAKKKDWYKNTLFIITADHTSPETKVKTYNNKVGRYSIPILYFMGDSSLNSNNSTVTQQIDIMPTILELLNYKKDYFSFGKSVLSKQNWAISYLNNEYLFITDSSYIFNKKEKYNSFSDANKKEKIKIKKEELNLFKAIKQNYNNRMINNKMTNEN